MKAGRPKLEKFLPLPRHVAAEVGRKLDWNDELIRHFAKSTINGRKIIENTGEELRRYVESIYLDPEFETFPKAETDRALKIIGELKAERLRAEAEAVAEARRQAEEERQLI